ncbi:hyalin-like, partial [Anneissia japonica]|uniref:hyalin-like n=1 Tax=Anneissia japonica TaxID=1529436 RepID=UPI001425779B
MSQRAGLSPMVVKSTYRDVQGNLLEEIQGFLHIFRNVYHAQGSINITCQNTWATLKCNGSHFIHVKSATFGRQETGYVYCDHTSFDTDNTNCGERDNALNVIADKCNCQYECSLFTSISRLLGGYNPCYGTYKYLEIDFECIQVLVCPSDVNVCNDVGHHTASVTWEPANFTDYCCANGVADANYINGYSFEIGTDVVEYSSSDCGNLMTTCQFNVVVRDCDAPNLSCLDNLAPLEVDDNCQADAIWDEVTADDNYDSLVNVDCDLSPDTFPLGNYTVQCNASDLAGNTGKCSFNFAILDLTPPALVCPDDITVPNNVGNNTAEVTWNLAVATDNCCGENIDVLPDIMNGSTFDTGITNVTLTAVDCNGNRNECVFRIEVKDSEPPDLECPPIQNLVGDNDCMASPTWTQPTVTDNSGEIILPVCDYRNGSTFSEMNTTVTCNATDNYGNVGFCTFNIIIIAIDICINVTCQNGGSCIPNLDTCRTSCTGYRCGT